MGSEYWQQAFRPLLPGISNCRITFAGLEQITSETACVIAETIQAEAGVIVPQQDWLKALRQRCDETGALLVLDEIQCGFGRNGTLWAFEQFGIVPDIFLLGKAQVAECHSALLWPTGKSPKQPHPRSGTGAYQYLRRAPGMLCCRVGRV